MMDADGGYGRDVVVPGVGRRLDEVPEIVRLWYWAICHLFQNAYTEELRELVPQWAGLEAQLNEDLVQVTGCRFEELVKEDPSIDPECVGEFATTSDSEILFVATAWGLRRGPDEYDIGVGFDVGLRYNTSTHTVTITYFEYQTG